MYFFFTKMIYNILFYIGIPIILLICYYLHCYTYWKKRGVQYLKPSIPFGNVSDIMFFRNNFGVHFQKIYNKLKQKNVKYGGTWSFTSPGLIILDPEVIKQIFIKDFSSFQDRGLYYNEANDPLSANLFNLEGEKWRIIRNKTSPTFTSGKMKMMFPIFIKCAEQLDLALEKFVQTGEPLIVKDFSTRFTLDIIGNCVLGLDCNSLNNPDTEFLRIGKKFFSTTLSNNIVLMVGSVFPFLLKLFGIKTTDDEVESFFLNVLRDNIEFREKNNIQRNDFMDMFIRLINNQSIEDDAMINNDKTKISVDKNQLTFEDLAAVAFIFFVAGYEPSSSTITFFLYEMAINQTVQEQLRKEIQETLKNTNGELTYDALMGMKYLDQCVNETLRKYPTNPTIIRRCTQDCKITDTDVTIEKGIGVVLSVMGIHFDPDIYPDPEKFDPERFTEEAKANRNRYLYLPFGEGPRNCIGLRFALLQVKVGIASLLNKYKFSLHPKTKVPIEWSPNGVLLFPKDDVILEITKIN